MAYKSRWTELKKEFNAGYKEAVRLGLDQRENWTPLYIYIHVSRLLLGMFMGILLCLPIIVLFILN